MRAMIPGNSYSSYGMGKAKNWKVYLVNKTYEGKG